MIFGGKYDEYQWRYTTWQGAVEGHIRHVSMVENELLCNRLKSGFKCQRLWVSSKGEVELNYNYNGYDHV